MSAYIRRNGKFYELFGKIQNIHFLQSSFPVPSIFQSHISGYNSITYKWLALAILSEPPLEFPSNTELISIITINIYSEDPVISTLQMKWNASYSCFLIKHKNSIGARNAKHYLLLKIG